MPASVPIIQENSDYLLQESGGRIYSEGLDLAAFLGTVKTQLLADIETTSAENAYDGFGDISDQHMPCAMLQSGNITFDSDINNVLDMHFLMTIAVMGRTWEATQALVEEIAILWLPTGNGTALDMDGVTNIQPEKGATPSATEEQTMAYYTGTLSLRVDLRFTYS